MTYINSQTTVHIQTVVRFTIRSTVHRKLLFGLIIFFCTSQLVASLVDLIQSCTRPPTIAPPYAPLFLPCVVRQSPVLTTSGVHNHKSSRPSASSSCAIERLPDPKTSSVFFLAVFLERGTMGTTYKAVLDNRLIVCVKRLDATKIGKKPMSVTWNHWAGSCTRTCSHSELIFRRRKKGFWCIITSPMVAFSPSFMLQLSAKSRASEVLNLSC
ncbi:hypothetical protein V2J09_004552 [Rumex salicifolius]